MELVNTAENAESLGKLEEAKSPLDVLLWMATMPTAGCKLVSKELDDEKVPIHDLQWVWRNSCESFTPKQVEFSFPILLDQTVDVWGVDDIQSLSKVLDRIPQLVLSLP